nr:peptidase M17 [Spirochaeta sp.]
MNNYFHNSGGDQKLELACQIAMRDSLKAGPGERVLIITNPYEDVALISMGLFDAALALGAEPALLFQPEKSQLEFAHESVFSAIAAEPEIVISISRLKLGKDRRGLQKPYSSGGTKYDSIFHYLLYGKKRVRGFWSPGVTRDIFVSTLPIDYEQLKKACISLKKKLEGSLALRITSRAGTACTIGTKGRQVFVDDGDFSRPGSGGNL